MPRASLCVQCGARRIQCPCDTLCFKNENGDIIPPETVRKFKLNLSGKRIIEAGRESQVLLPIKQKVIREILPEITAKP